MVKDLPTVFKLTLVQTVEQRNEIQGMFYGLLYSETVQSSGDNVTEGVRALILVCAEPN